MTKMFARQNSSTKTILLKSPDSNRVREVVITEIVVPSSRNSIEKLSFLNRMESKIMSKPSRKRRLDHLSQEEKIMRKKLKNREAAQTSRDRKKAKLEELESTVCLLQKQNEALCDEVQSLRMERDGLQRENAALSDELWRLRVGEAGASAEGPAAGSRAPASTQPAGIPTPPPTPSPPHAPVTPIPSPLHVSATPTSLPLLTIPKQQNDDLDALADSDMPYDIDWLSTDKICTPDLEELEKFADSLFKQAIALEEADKIVTSDAANDTVTIGVCKRETEDIADTMECDRSPTPCPLSHRQPSADNNQLTTSEVVDNNVSVESEVKHEEENDEVVFSSQPQTILLQPACDSIIPGELVIFSSQTTLDNVVCIDDVVEEVEVVSDNISCYDVDTDDTDSDVEIVECCPVVCERNGGKCLVEEVHSDHGYESVGSPESDDSPVQLRQLFPELW